MTLLATDVHYSADAATAAGVVFEQWGDAKPLKTNVVKLDEVRPYQPGRFFERELPCLLALLDEIRPRPDMIIIDGFVTLGTEEKDGLGAHLYRALNASTPVIGVAKTPFRDTPAQTALLRGNSNVPLFVTSMGIPQELAKQNIQTMHGPYRIPTLLRAVDQLSRGISA